MAFSLVHKLLAFNRDQPRVAVVILSRNDPVSGMRVFRSAQSHGLTLERGVFTRGESPWRYLRPLQAQLFLSANEADVRSALAAGVPAARVLPHARQASDAHPDELRIDLDPQPGTNFADAVAIALLTRELLDELGLVGPISKRLWKPLRLWDDPALRTGP